MADRIYRALDGELPIDMLTPTEREELQRYRAIVGIALEPIRRLPEIDVAPAVMQRVAPRPPVVHRARAAAAAVARWFWAPQALTLRPAYVMAGALAAVALLSTARARPAPSASSVAAGAVAPAPARVLVQFRLGDAQAHDVALVGDFNGWHPRHQLHQVAPGVWSVDVALEPGVYHYVFVVDGKAYRLDPLAPRVTDGFGGASSRVSVLAPGARS